MLRVVLFCAVERGDRALLRLLCRTDPEYVYSGHIDFKATNEEDLTVLHVAAAKGEKDLFDMILDECGAISVPVRKPNYVILRWGFNWHCGVKIKLKNTFPTGGPS